ncbi:MAG: SRPBCC family protein [Alphaproteobacteria bacterium]
MRAHSATIEIGAAPNKIWAIITNTPSYPSFDPTCIRVVGGKATEGARLRVYSTLSPPERAFQVRVTTFAPPRLMVWTGGMPFGLLKGVRTFEIHELSPDKCRFSLSEQFSGPMLGLISRSIPDMTDAFEGFCRGLKELAEA